MGTLTWQWLVWILGLGECLAICQHFLTATSQVQYLLSHKNYNRAEYPNNLNCTWLIEPEVNYGKVILLMKEFELNPSDCKFDNLKIYDGSEKNESALRGILCGQLGQGKEIQSRGFTPLLLWFQSDATSSAKGFKIYYHAAGFEDPNATFPSPVVGTSPPQNATDTSGRLVLNTKTAILAVAAIALVVTVVFLLLLCGIYIMRKNKYCLKGKRSTSGEYYIIKRGSMDASELSGYANIKGENSRTVSNHEHVNHEYLTLSNHSSGSSSQIRVWTTNSDTSL